MAFVPNIKYKTQYCLYWQEGKSCQKGLNCFFAHGEKELRTIEDNQEQILARNSEKGQPQGRPHNYKTIFCKFYQEGKCKLGEKCTYAHQRKEKRKKKFSQQYKEGDDYAQPQWSQAQWNQYYQQQYYYYQMTQMAQMSQHANPFSYKASEQQLSHQGQNQSKPQTFEQKSEEAQHEEIKGATKNATAESKIQQSGVQTPQIKKGEQSPGSGQTEANTVGTLTRLDSLGPSSQFKSEE